MQATTLPPPPPRHQDPRNIVTEDAYRLAPELLGTPLARPWRRGAAMAVDGVLIALLSNAPSVLFGFAAALILFRVSARPSPQGGYLRRSLRIGFRFWGAVMLFVATVTAWNSASDRVGGMRLSLGGAGDDEAAEAAEALEGVSTTVEGVSLQGLDGLRVAAEVARFSQADDAAEAHERLANVVPVLRAGGLDDEELAEVLRGMASEPGRPWLMAAVDSVLRAMPAAPEPEPELAPDSLALAYAAALGGGEEDADALGARLGLALAADTIAELQAELGEAREDRRDLAARVDEMQEELDEGIGVVSVLRAVVTEDLGLGLGWAGLYFTAFVALWKGRTPGKRLLGVRIIRLDAKPIGWWAAFERFGGYAAGFATGLLGFFQIYWDRNRQAVHDKISETVVIRG